MEEDEIVYILDLDELSQGKVLLRLLYELTIEVRSIIYDKKDNYDNQIRGMNQINHMVLPLLSKLLLKEEETYTISAVIENLSEMGSCYGIENNIKLAWKRVQIAP